MAITFKDDAVVQTALGIGPQGSLYGIFASPDNPWDIITEAPQYSVFFKTTTGQVWQKTGTGYTITDWTEGLGASVQPAITVKDSGANVYTGPVVLDYLNSLAATNPSGADIEVKLVNDAETPGNNYVYGTSDTGVKGWYEINQVIAPGHTIQLDWRFDTSTTASSPASGRFRMNNSNPALVTELYLHDVTRSGLDASAIIDALHADSLIYIQQGDTAANFVLAKITAEPVDNTGWWTVQVAIQDSGTLFGNQKDCVFIFIVDSESGISGIQLEVDSTPVANTPHSIFNFSDDFTIADVDGEAATIDLNIDTGAASKVINAPGDWTLSAGTTYYNDFTHNLGTQDLVFQARNTATNEVEGVEDWDVLNDNTVRIYIEGNATSIRAIAVTGRGPVGPQGPTGPAGGGLANVVEDLTPQLGGDLDLNGFGVQYKVPTANGGYSGEIVQGTVDSNATGLGAALYMASDGNFDEADADASTTAPCRVLALETGTGTKKLLLKGFLRVDTWAWTPGGDIYLSTTTGALTQTAPSGDGDQVQRLGYAWDADTIYFSPGDYTVVEVNTD